MALNKDGFEAGSNLTFAQIQSLRKGNPAPKPATVPEPDAPKPDAVPGTPDVIQMMPKGEVIGWLEAHGVEKPEGKVADLRRQLIDIMFVSDD